MNTWLHGITETKLFQTRKRELEKFVVTGNIEILPGACLLQDVFLLLPQDDGDDIHVLERVELGDHVHYVLFLLIHEHNHCTPRVVSAAITVKEDIQFSNEAS